MQLALLFKLPTIYSSRNVAKISAVTELERDKNCTEMCDKNCTKNRMFKRALRSAKCGSGRKDKAAEVDIEERQSSLLSPSPSLFPTVIFDIVCYFCGIFITKPGGCSRFSGRPSLLCSAVQTASVRVDTPRYNYMELPPTENGSCLCKYFHG